MENNIKNVKDFYNSSYSQYGFSAQRRYPNEELCRFMGRNFFSIPTEQRKEIKILETGCGSGANLWMLAKEGFDVFGIDLSEDSLILCNKMLQQYSTQANISVQNMSCTNFTPNSFHCIVDVFSSYCLDKKNGNNYIKHMFYLLRPGGLFFSYFPSKTSVAFQDHLPAILLDSDTLDSIKRIDSPYTGQAYPFRFLYPDEYAECLKSHGFKIKSLETVQRSYHNQKEIFEFVVVEALKA